MFLTFEDRPSNSPVERLWRSYSTTGGPFHSMAEGNLELVVTRLGSFAQVTLWGPSPRQPPSTARPTANGSLSDSGWGPTSLGYRPLSSLTVVISIFRQREMDSSGSKPRPGRFPAMRTPRFSLPGLPSEGSLPSSLRSKPPSSAPLTCLAEGPSNAISFVLRASRTPNSARSSARHAVELLRNGTGILDVVHDAGYFDQPHLTRSLKYLIGQTPMKILRNEAQLSFSYKTELAEPR
jgi:hypothetical protein